MDWILRTTWFAYKSREKNLINLNIFWRQFPRIWDNIDLNFVSHVYWKDLCQCVDVLFYMTVRYRYVLPQLIGEFIVSFCDKHTHTINDNLQEIFLIAVSVAYNCDSLTIWLYFSCIAYHTNLYSNQDQFIFYLSLSYLWGCVGILASELRYF